jgi:primosomal protein N' (replication factor Y)
MFPNASMMRMDLDTTSRRGAHDRILRKFSEGEIDILLGTQMIAKGLDFSRVTLVGVISADTQMLLPDFRSAERTFQLLTQVSGRAGRSVLSGEVIIQTFQPQHYVLKHVVDHDFKSFFQEEMPYRNELSYPPVSRIVLIECKGKNEQEVERAASHFVQLLRQQKSSVSILGPSAAGIPKINMQFRWHIVLKDLKRIDPSSRTLHRVLREAIDGYARSVFGRSKSVRLIVDVDPAGMI